MEKKEKEKELSFEESIKKLETIVRELESGDVLLDDAINKFNEAVSLAKLCDTKLKTATESVNKILNEDSSLKEFKIEE